ncbi:unnamed protein product, partial [Mesorhabditis spiculigera]
MRFFGDWLISLHTTGFRSPSKTPEQLKLERSFSPEGTAARKKIIAEAGAEPEIGGVLVYDGRKFKMIHLIPVHRYYRVQVWMAATNEECVDYVHFVDMQQRIVKWK